MLLLPLSEDLQEQGKYGMGQRPQKLGQQNLSMLEGGEYMHTLSIAYTVGKALQSIISFSLKYT